MMPQCLMTEQSKKIAVETFLCHRELEWDDLIASLRNTHWAWDLHPDLVLNEWCNEIYPPLLADRLEELAIKISSYVHSNPDLVDN